MRSILICSDNRPDHRPTTAPLSPPSSPHYSPNPLFACSVYFSSLLQSFCLFMSSPPHVLLLTRAS